ncbi:hypothetical protein HQQ94_00770 [Shewanella sp. VB17]|uniref:FlgO family outer membrane protein n=1 Tax=Shewanella sp. VB17 TaxID=2739432 RepID=UPI001564EE84|nr:FlgO family outer membrane protein [Shewanella sp. VB17]NRD71809.1 hypothetical protein [Shewanella sp. VB17]
MKKSLQTYSLLFVTLLAAGCATLDDTTRLCANDKGEFYKCVDAELEQEMAVSTEKTYHDFQSERSFQTLNEYTEQMVYRLHQKLSRKKIAKSIVVPPFVSLSAIGSSNPNFAIDLAEAFIIDMQNIGLPTAELLWANISIDYQTDYLTYLEKSSGYDDIGYVLKGTMRKTSNGIMIYARVIDIESKKVVASTAKLLPLYLI